jgi:hypothetical protein
VQLQTWLEGHQESSMGGAACHSATQLGSSTVTLQCITAAGEDRKTVEATGELAAFIKAEKMPPTLEFNDDNSYKIFNSGIEKQVGVLVASGLPVCGNGMQQVVCKQPGNVCIKLGVEAV